MSVSGVPKAGANRKGQGMTGGEREPKSPARGRGLSRWAFVPRTGVGEKEGASARSLGKEQAEKAHSRMLGIEGQGFGWKSPSLFFREKG